MDNKLVFIVVIVLAAAGMYYFKKQGCCGCKKHAHHAKATVHQPAKK
jgi:hypothetical protein